MIGVDVGGTFTDVVVVDGDGAICVYKVPSTQRDPSIAVLHGLQVAARAAGAEESTITTLLHGTTVATNAVIERTGGRVALITTAGFRDVLEIGRLRRRPEELYNLGATEREVIVPRHLRLELSERTNATGQVVRPVAREEVAELARFLREHDVRFVAVCLLHSHRNPENELAVARLLGELVREVRVTLAHEVLSETGEYERTCAAVLNAYLMGPIRPYLHRLTDRLAERSIPASPYLMQSNGGVIDADTAAEFPVRLLLSGPAGGIAASVRAVGECGVRNIVTFDMGGTSCDVGVIVDGKVSVTTQRDLAGMPIRMPSVDVVSIGTGGGSIAWTDGEGRFRVGPQSAGAEPGPACYGRGGHEATVTDADVVLGYLRSYRHLGAESGIDIDGLAAEAACRRLGRQVGLDTVEEVAWSILELAHTQMAGAVRNRATARGIDLRRFSLLAFGGAGPVHAVQVATKAGMRGVIVPPHPGCHSAYGLLRAGIRQDFVVPLEGRLGCLAPALIDKAFEVLDSKLPGQGADGSASDGVFAAAADVVYQADLRYAGQQFAVIVDLRSARELHEHAEVRRRFETAHENLYGHADHGRVVEILAVRATHTRRSQVEQSRPTGGAGWESDTPAAGIATRRAWFPGTNWVDIPVVDRFELPEGRSIAGPLVVEQPDTTILIPPGVQAREVDGGYLMIEIPEALQ